MDSLQTSYRDDDEDEVPQPQNDVAQQPTSQSPAPVHIVEPANSPLKGEEPESTNDTAREPKSSPKEDGAQELESPNDDAQEASDEPQSQPDSISESVVLEAQREHMVSYSITQDAAAQEPEPQNDAAQEAQPETTVTYSIPESAAQKPDSQKDAALEAQREPMFSDSISVDAAAQETQPQNYTAQEAQPEPMVTDSVSEEDADEAEPQNHAVREARPDILPEPMVSESVSEDDPTASEDTQKSPKPDNIATQNDDVEEDEDEDDDPPPKKQKQLSSLTTLHEQQPLEQQQQTPVIDNNLISKTNLTPLSGTATKKSKKKNNNVWVSRTTRKGKKKNKINPQKEVTPEETVLITPVPRFPDKGDDNPEMKICLSKVYKAEKVELSEDRLTAGTTKGYRMVRATRGVVEGAWYYEIKVVTLGETGHTRLGWSTEKGDLQAPVGYDGNGFAYRDIDGCKVHKALREKYGEEGYKEGDVIGFYINLPEGGQYAPKTPRFVWYKGQRYVCAPDAKEDPPKVVPGSEISFFKNGVCQGVAFKDLYGGRYHPAASMYTLPNQPNCVVKFNFGPDFECFPDDFGECPVPSPMVEIPYHGFDSQAENGVSNENKH